MKGISSCCGFSVACSKRAVVGNWASILVLHWKQQSWTSKFVRSEMLTITIWVFTVKEFFCRTRHVCGITAIPKHGPSKCGVLGTSLCLCLIFWLASLQPFRRLCFSNRLFCAALSGIKQFITWASPNWSKSFSFSVFHWQATIMGPVSMRELMFIAFYDQLSCNNSSNCNDSFSLTEWQSLSRWSIFLDNSLPNRLSLQTT